MTRVCGSEKTLRNRNRRTSTKLFLNMYRRRVPYIADNALYKDFYRGGNLPVFRGVYQDGSGLIGNFFRSVIPIVKPILASAGKTLLKTGVSALDDVLSGERDFKRILKRRGIEGLKTVGKDVTEQALKSLKTEQSGGWRGQKRKTRKRKRTPDIFDNQEKNHPKRRCKTTKTK